MRGTRTRPGGAVHEVADTDYDAAAAQERIRAFQTYKSTEKPRYASLKVGVGRSR